MPQAVSSPVNRSITGLAVTHLDHPTLRAHFHYGTRKYSQNVQNFPWKPTSPKPPTNPTPEEGGLQRLRLAFDKPGLHGQASEAVLISNFNIGIYIYIYMSSMYVCNTYIYIYIYIGWSCCECTSPPLSRGMQRKRDLLPLIITETKKGMSELLGSRQLAAHWSASASSHCFPGTANVPTTKPCLEVHGYL